VAKLAKKARGKLTELIETTYPKLKYTAKRKFLFWTKTSRDIRRELGVRVPQEKELKKFYREIITKRTCEKIKKSGVGEGRYEAPPQYVAAWHQFLNKQHAVVKSERAFRGKGIQVTYDIFLFDGQRCTCKNILNHLKKMHRGDNTKLRQIAQGEMTIKVSGRTRCKIMQKEKCGKAKAEKDKKVAEKKRKSAEAKRKMMANLKKLNPIRHIKKAIRWVKNRFSRKRPLPRQRRPNAGRPVRKPWVPSIPRPTVNRPRSPSPRPVVNRPTPVIHRPRPKPVKVPESDLPEPNLHPKLKKLITHLVIDSDAE